METQINTHANFGVGQVKYVHFPIVKVDGLLDSRIGEMVHFEAGGFGKIIALEDKLASIMLFSAKIPRVESNVTRVDHEPQIFLCEHVLGDHIDSFGKQKGENLPCNCEREARRIDVAPPKLTKRSPITLPLKTGISVVDLLLPLGRGQRELVVGDRKTGRTSFLLQTAMAQIEQGTVVVFACIGKKSSEIQRIWQVLNQGKTNKRMVLVSSASDDTASMIVQTPFAAMTVAEYLCGQGENVLVIFDDLTTHAKYYRELSLLARQFPGRDSYPGDMFFLHARLLERAGNFKHEKGFSSITCLPSAETQENELTNFVVSNLISITDGHLLFHSELFARGLRPAIHHGLSVTRVGRQTQSKIERELSYKLGSFLSSYEKTRTLLQFGAELNEHTRRIIARGDALMSSFTQSQNLTLPPTISILFSMSILLDWCNDKSPVQICKLRDDLVMQYQTKPKVKQLLEKLIANDTYAGIEQSFGEHEVELKKIWQL